jgi:DNA-binding CsgD family transcriptional regulator
MLALSLGRPDEARDLLASEQLGSMVRLVPHTVYSDHLVTLVELLADGGEVEAAAAQRDRLITLLQPSTSTLGEGFIDRACAAVAPDAQADDLFCRAEERIGGGVHVFELAMTRLRHARWLRRRRRRGEAAARLQRARSVFLDLGCATWAQTCADELAAVGAGVARRDRYDVSGSLTAQERRVAEAVAEGITNDDVARRLFLSPRTVEVHLTHVYRKLGVRGRSELVRMMASAPAGGPL